MVEKKKKKKLKLKYIHRDISWLSFNERVLQEAEDKRVPLIERVRFMGIFSNNQDEFFRVRIATLRRMARVEKSQIKKFEINPLKIINQIQKKVLLLKTRFDDAYIEILNELKKEKIFIVNEKELNAEQTETVRQYFYETVRPRLFPIMIDSIKKLPALSDKSIYLAIRLTRKTKISGYSLIEVPDGDPSRFFVLPGTDEKKYIILLDDIIRSNLKLIFQTFDFDTIDAYTIKITRDAELELDTDLSQSMLELIQKSLKRRVKGEPVRFIYDAEMPREMLDFFTRKLKLQKEDALIPGARYHNFKDFMNFPALNRVDLQFKKNPPVTHPSLSSNTSILHILRSKDVMLHFPYQTFNHIIDMLREAAINPSVTSIHITLYRVAHNSSIVMSLINAARNGKNVTVIMELQARFDEENNIFWANKMQEEGVKVLFGANNLKVHAKLCLITETINGKTFNYAITGSGNFNEHTAKLYTDIFLLTSNLIITKEIKKIFSFFENQFSVGKYKHVILAPIYLRKRMKQLINRETKNALSKKPAFIFMKLNNLIDKEIIKKLYEASQAGVKIRLIVRSACSLVAGVENLSGNIKVISILDKFLEHSRIYFFHNAGNEEIFTGSADMMERNIDFRVETLVEVIDKKIKKQLKEILEIQWSDTMKARSLMQGHLNEYVRTAENTKNIRSQLALYEYFSAYYENEKIKKPN